MRDDNFQRLPESVTATLLRALMTIRPRPDNRLTLQRPEEDRAPGWDRLTDYHVIWRGQRIGRVWQYAYVNHPWTGLGPWHWQWSSVPGKPNTEGHAPTLEAAMADFRRAWDASSASVA